MTRVQLLLSAQGMRFDGDVLLVDAPAAIQAGLAADSFFDEMLRIERHTQRPLAMLVDVRGLPPAAFNERAVAYRRRAEWSQRRVAVVGESRFQEFVINWLVDATGHRRARYFTDEALARAWLAEAIRAA